MGFWVSTQERKALIAATCDDHTLLLLNSNDCRLLGLGNVLILSLSLCPLWGIKCWSLLVTDPGLRRTLHWLRTQFYQCYLIFRSDYYSASTVDRSSSMWKEQVSMKVSAQERERAQFMGRDVEILADSKWVEKPPWDCRIILQTWFSKLFLYGKK